MSSIVRTAFRKVRASESDSGMPTMTVRFSKLNSWYEIKSFWEGEFLERIAPGAFDSISDPSEVRVLFNHGFDPSVGQKALGVPTVIEERDGYACADVPLFDAAYVRELLPGIRAGAYGSSFMFDAEHESWDWEPETSADNPKGIPQRTIESVRLYEQGPVTFPANPGADVQCDSQSGTDWYYRQLETSGSLSQEDRTSIRSKLAMPARPGGKHAGLRLRALREMELRK